MNVLYIHQYFKTPDMVGGTRSYEMAKRIVAAGWGVDVLTTRIADSRGDIGWVQTKEDGINIHWLYLNYSNKMGFLSRVWAFIYFSMAASLKVFQLKFDLVFATSTPLTVAIPGVFATKIKKVPMVFEVRDLWPEIPIALGILRNRFLCWAARRLETYAYRNSTSVIALSPGMKAGVVRAGYPEKNVAVIPNGCDFDLFKYSTVEEMPNSIDVFLNSRKPLILYAGTLGLINGVGSLVDLAIGLRDIGSSIQILIVGDGIERESIMERATIEDVYNKNLFMVDPIPKNAMPALIKRATIACSLFIDLPEMRVNSANKVFDAMASGTPVLVNYGGWINDLLVSKEFGVSMWGADIKSFSKTLDKTLTDEKWVEFSGRQAISVAKSYFDRDVLAAQLIEVLLAAVEGNGRTASKIAPGEYS